MVLHYGRQQRSPLLPDHYIDVTADTVRILRQSLAMVTSLNLPSGNISCQYSTRFGAFPGQDVLGNVRSSSCSDRRSGARRALLP